MRIKRARRTSSAGKVRERRRIFSSRRSEGVRCRACISMPKHTTCQYHFQCYTPLVWRGLSVCLEELQRAQRVDEPVFSCKLVKEVHALQVVLIQRIINIPGQVVQNLVFAEVQFAGLLLRNLAQAGSSVFIGFPERPVATRSGSSPNSPKGKYKRCSGLGFPFSRKIIDEKAICFCLECYITDDQGCIVILKHLRKVRGRDL